MSGHGLLRHCPGAIAARVALVALHFPVVRDALPVVPTGVLDADDHLTRWHVDGAGLGLGGATVVAWGGGVGVCLRLGVGPKV